MLQVSRSQFPVGQGCFHVCQVKWTEDESQTVRGFSFVYDCGATKQGAVSEAIDYYRIENSHVDALFVSHLHKDHVSGIDRLLSAVQVDTVYIPYLDNLLPVLDVIEADIEGTLSGSLMEAKIDPQAWFGRRGVSRVVRVMAFPEGDVPVDDDDMGPVEPKGEVGFEPTVKPKGSGARLRRAEMKVMASGEVVTISGVLQPYDWILVPHVDPAPQRNVERFNRCIRLACGLRPRERLTSTRLANGLRDPQKRKALRQCYDDITRGGGAHSHNRISMSLYSGPRTLFDAKGSSLVVSGATSGRFGSLPEVQHGWFLGLGSVAAGWIGTGDAKLREEVVRRAWLHTYRPYERGVMTMLLPHHGSRKDFHSDLLSFSKSWHLRSVGWKGFKIQTSWAVCC